MTETTFPKNVPALWKSSLLTLKGKLAATVKPLISGSSSIRDDEDITLLEFLRAKWGEEVAEYLFGPLYGGVHASSANSLSVRALYPQLLKPIVDDKTSQKRKGFVSLKGGMQELIRSLIDHLEVSSLRPNSQIEQIELDEDNSYLLTNQNGQVFKADALILAAPSYVAAPLLKNLSPKTSELLGQIRHSSSAIVTLAYENSKFKPGTLGSGFIVPSREGEVVSGCTISSHKWANRSRPEDLLLRVFIGRGDHTRDISQFDDKELSDVATECIQRHLHLSDTPTLKLVDRWPQGLPQYSLGHIDLVKAARASSSHLPNFHFTGVSYGGIGIPDCIRQGKEGAKLLWKYIQSSQRTNLSNSDSVEDQANNMTALA